MSEQEEDDPSLAFEEDDILSSDTGYQEIVEQYGLAYQKYAIEEAVYYVPVDEEEEYRLSIQHTVVTKFLDDKLIFGQLTGEPERILDCGYGQADWALAVAKQYQNCEITGIDIHPLDLADIPHNLTLLCEDLNLQLAEVLPFEHFDLIQSRFISNGLHRDRWSSYIQELVRLLRPGGWLQMIEFYYNFQSHSGLLNASHALYQWGTKYRLAAERLERNPRMGSMTNLAILFESTRLERAFNRNCSLPVGGWSRDPREKEIGLENLRNIDRMLVSLGTWPFRAVLGMSKEEVDDLVGRAQMELRDTSLKLYLPMTLCYARRPEDS